jgi:DNA-binding NtrC family response regulator
MQAISGYSWLGNVRELKHQVSRAVLLSKGPVISESDLMLPSRVRVASPVGEATSPVTLDEAEKVLIENALKQASGNVSEAARLLGITRMTIRYRMDKHGIRSGD